MTYTEATTKYGSVTIGGTKFALLDYPTLTNSVFPNWWGDATEGESYISQWSAPIASQEEFATEDFDASDLSDTGEVIYEFPAVKGEEPEDDEWPWGNDEYVRLSSQSKTRYGIA